MKISPIMATQSRLKNNFKGYTVDDWGPMATHLGAAERTGRRMEKTLGVFHPNSTYKIYYADPLEVVTDELREKVDYVVYDDEPIFPDVNLEISKDFFHPEVSAIYDNIRDIEKYRDYFHRMIKADSKVIGEYEKKAWQDKNNLVARQKADYYKARVADAEHNKKTAIAFLEELAWSTNPRKENHDNYNKVCKLESSINYLNSKDEKAKKQIAERMGLDSILNEKISSLNENIEQYKNFIETVSANKTVNTEDFEKTLTELRYSSYQDNYFYDYSSNDKSGADLPLPIDSYKKIKEDLAKDAETEVASNNSLQQIYNNLTSQLDKYLNAKEENKKIVDFLENFVKVVPTKIQSLKDELALAKEAFEKSKADLIPFFDKLKEIMAKNKLRIVK